MTYSQYFIDEICQISGVLPSYYMAGVTFEEFATQKENALKACFARHKCLYNRDIVIAFVADYEALNIPISSRLSKAAIRYNVFGVDRVKKITFDDLPNGEISHIDISMQDNIRITAKQEKEVFDYGFGRDKPYYHITQRINLFSSFYRSVSIKANITRESSNIGHTVFYETEIWIGDRTITDAENDGINKYLYPITGLTLPQAVLYLEKFFEHFNWFFYQNKVAIADTRADIDRIIATMNIEIPKFNTVFLLGQNLPSLIEKLKTAR